MGLMRTHVAGPDTREPFPITPTEQPSLPGHKPHGFWWEVDGDWRRWCTEENYGHMVGNLFTVDLGRSRICTIRTVSELDAFHTRWSAPLISEPYGHGLIRWDLVAEVWDGIEIAPYRWERRLSGAAHSWYYSWDCASGCVWNPVGATVQHVGTWQP